jgi:hypothetical protein
MGKKRSRLVLVVLAGSVALNVFLLVSWGRARRGSSTHKPHASSSAPRADCCQGLAHCQRQRWAMALRALQGRQAARTQQKAVAAPHPPTPPSAPTSAVGPTEQQAALCALATEQLRRDWTAKGDALTKSLRKSLADHADQEKGMQREVERFGDGLSLTPADRDRFETHYRPLRKKRIAEALASLEKHPPDWTAVHQAARALYTDQDRLTKELFGSNAVSRLRQSELKSRTAILALASAQAGLDWNKSIEW